MAESTSTTGTISAETPVASSSSATSTSTSTTTPAKKSNTLTIVSIVVAALFLISLAGNIWLLNKNKTYKAAIVNTHTKLQVIETEKTDLQDKITVLSEQKQTLDRSLASAFNNMQAKDIIIDQLNKENTTLSEIKTQVGELEKVSNTMNGQIKNLNTSREALKQIQDKVNKTISSKQTENQKTKAKIK
jgi:hypothetical protein